MFFNPGNVSNSGNGGTGGSGDGHIHSNLSTLNKVTESKLREWDNKSNFSGNYNDLTNKPTIPTVDVTKVYVDSEVSKKADKTHSHSEYATPSYVQEKIAEASLSGGEVDLSAYATIGFVEQEIEKIELTPGPQGLQGPKGDKGDKGVGLGFEWSGTRLGIKKDTDISYTYIELKGEKGVDGYTPIKGIDYFTNEDKLEIIASVLQEFPIWEGGEY